MKIAGSPVECVWPDAGFVDASRAATNGGWALGNDKFRKEIARAAKRRVTKLPPGPKAKGSADRRQLSLF